MQQVTVQGTTGRYGGKIITIILFISVDINYYCDIIQVITALHQGSFCLKVP